MMIDILARILNFAIMIVLPFGLALIFFRKLKAGWGLFGIGVVTFVVSQVFHIPFNRWVLGPLVESTGLSLSYKGWGLLVVSVMYGVSAGLFEEVTRYLGYRLWIKNDRTWRSALMYGVGHGGIESVLLGLLVLATFIQVMALRGVDLNSVFEPEQVALAQAQIDAYWAAPWYQAVLGAVERMAAIPIQLSASVLVLQVFRRKNVLWLLLAVGWHTLVDAAAVFALTTWGMYIAEALVGFLGLVSVGFIFFLKSEEEDPDISLPSTFPALPDPQALPPTEESLEDSRFI